MRGKNQKLKLLYLAKIMQEQTDDTHALTMPQIIAELAKYDIEAQRKSIYDDLAALDDFGIEIIKEMDGFRTYYHCGNRDFEIAEIKILVDAIQSSKFISQKKTEDLIHKLEKSLSNYDAKLFDREVKVAGRVKSMNESIYYTVDAIHTAISENKSITFKYFSWNIKGEEEYRRGGADYEVSPWALHFDDERYYLIAYDHQHKELRHYRVDKMRKVVVTDANRKGKTLFNSQDRAKYNEQYFRMYGGEFAKVTLRCKNEMANVIIDQFGTDVRLVPVDDEHFEVRVNVAVSSQFLAWVIALEGNAKIVGPDNVKKAMQDLIKKKYVE
ncbi:MAG: WYL domain-containing protein [Eubacterium sp.]|nr:WYL domain-containing protein [Eubacterium sp.]